LAGPKAKEVLYKICEQAALLFLFFIILIADMHLVKSIERDFTHE